MTVVINRGEHVLIVSEPDLRAGNPIWRVRMNLLSLTVFGVFDSGILEVIT